MTQSSMIVHKGGSSSVRRKLESEDEIIQIPECDLSAVADRFRLTLIGRVFHLKGRSIEALIHLLPRNRIWNVEGRVRGINLGNGRFQFDFDNETDLLSMLNKRPCHFNQWSFALERWEPFTSETFPNTIPFWVSVTGVPVHFWNDPTFIEISKVLGKWTSLDSKRARFQVSVNVDEPLQFERRLEFPNGDIGRVSFSYEGLFRYCYTCHMIFHDESTCPQLTPEERELKRQQRLEQNVQGDLNLCRSRNEDRNANWKRSRSPSNGRHSPPVGRPRNSSSSNHSPSDYRREEKKQRYSSDHENRDLRSSQKDVLNDLEAAKRIQPLNEDVWRRLELPPRRSSAYGKNNPSRDLNRGHRYLQKNSEPRRSVPYNRHQGHRTLDSRSWRPRSPLKSTPHTTTAPMSSSAPHVEHDDPAREVPSRAVSDSQRTISDQLGQLELGEIRRTQPKSPVTETAEERLRRLKGKAHITDTPTSRERESRHKQPSLIIREPGDVNQPTSPRHNSPKQVASSTEPPTMKPKNLDTEMDLAIDFIEDPDIALTEEDLALVDSMVKETELYEMDAEMDAEMMENDDLLIDDEFFAELPDENAEKIDAISQLSPGNAIYDSEMQEERQPLERQPLAPTVPAHTSSVTATKTRASAPEMSSATTTATAPIQVAPAPIPPKYTAKGYLKKNVPKSPDMKSVKATKASKKLTQLRGRNSPRKRSALGNPPTVSSSSKVPRNEVFPSAKSKKPLSLSGSVVSQKPPSKKI